MTTPPYDGLGKTEEDYSDALEATVDFDLDDAANELLDTAHGVPTIEADDNLSDPISDFASNETYVGLKTDVDTLLKIFKLIGSEARKSMADLSDLSARVDRERPRPNDPGTCSCGRTSPDTERTELLAQVSELVDLLQQREKKIHALRLNDVRNRKSLRTIRDLIGKLDEERRQLKHENGLLQTTVADEELRLGLLESKVDILEQKLRIASDLNTLQKADIDALKQENEDLRTAGREATEDIDFELFDSDGKIERLKFG